MFPTQSRITKFRFASRQSNLMLSAQLSLAVTVSSSQIFRPTFCVRFTFCVTPPPPILSLIIHDRGHTVKLLLNDSPCSTQLYSVTGCISSRPFWNVNPDGTASGLVTVLHELYEHKFFFGRGRGGALNKKSESQCMFQQQHCN